MAIVDGLNLIDGILILTASKFILHPFIGKYTDLNLIKQALLSVLEPKLPLELKPKVTLPRPEPQYYMLPDDVMAIILSKLDIFSVHNCALALGLETTLPLVTSLYTPLPASMFRPHLSATWFGGYLNKMTWKTTLFLYNEPFYIPRFIRRGGLIALSLFLMLFNVVRFYGSSETDFLSRLSGLTTLEVQLPALPFLDYLASSAMWFRWDAKVGMESRNYYLLYVIGDITQQQEEGEHEHDADIADEGILLSDEKVLQRLLIILRHSMFHYSMMLQLLWGGLPGLNMMTHDFGGNGGMQIGRASLIGQSRLKVCYLPTTLQLSNATSDYQVLQVKDVMVFFFMVVGNSDDYSIGTDNC